MNNSVSSLQSESQPGPSATIVSETSTSGASTSEASTSATTSRKRAKKYTSPVWNYFEKSDAQFACCVICCAKYQHSNNTSNLAKVRKKFFLSFACCQQEIYTMPMLIFAAP